MNILQNIKDDNLEARKAKRKHISSTLNPLISEIAMIGKDNGNRETTDAETVIVLKKFIKNIKLTMSLIKGENNFGSLSDSILDKLYDLERELNLIQGYLPTQITKSKLEIIISDIITKGKNNIGAIMKELNNDYNGLYDNRIAMEIIKRQLNQDPY